MEIKCYNCLSKDVCKIKFKDLESPCKYFKDGDLYIKQHCKIGDPVYEVVWHGFKIKKPLQHPHAIVQYEVVGFHYGDFPRTRGHIREEYLIVLHKGTNSIKHIPVHKLHKKYFLDYEDARKILDGEVEGEWIP